jgi:hypothetical protein
MRGYNLVIVLSGNKTTTKKVKHRTRRELTGAHFYMGRCVKFRETTSPNTPDTFETVVSKLLQASLPYNLYRNGLLLSFRQLLDSCL